MEDIKKLREEIDKTDMKILSLILERISLAKKIGNFKKLHKLKIINTQREKEILQNLANTALDKKINANEIKKIWRSLIKLSYAVEGEKDDYN